MKKILILLATLLALPWTIRAQDTTYKVISSTENEVCIEHHWGNWLDFSDYSKYVDYYDTLCYHNWPDSFWIKKPPRVFHIDTVGWKIDTLFHPSLRPSRIYGYFNELGDDVFDKYNYMIHGYYTIDSIPILDTTETNHGTYYVPRGDK